MAKQQLSTRFHMTATLAVLATVAFGGHVAKATNHKDDSARRCLPASVWSATDGLRPCVNIAKVYEDGSFKYVVSDANGTTRYSGGVGVPDSYEKGQR